MSRSCLGPKPFSCKYFQNHKDNEVPGALRVHGQIIFWFVSQAFSALGPLVLRDSARARRFERARRLRGIIRRPKAPSRIENARFEVSVARLARNTVRMAIAKTHAFQSEKVENGRHHRRLSGAARHARGDSNARDG